MAKKSIRELGVDDFVKAGLSATEANELKELLLLPLSLSSDDPADIWRHLVSHRVLKPSYPHPLHQLLYYTIYSHHQSSSSPPLYWFPSL
jgi:mediator of RNA polymerase II transcription subunit 13